MKLHCGEGLGRSVWPTGGCSFVITATLKGLFEGLRSDSG